MLSLLFIVILFKAFLADITFCFIFTFIINKYVKCITFTLQVIIPLVTLIKDSGICCFLNSVIDTMKFRLFLKVLAKLEGVIRLSTVQFSRKYIIKYVALMIFNQI